MVYKSNEHTSWILATWHVFQKWDIVLSLITNYQWNLWSINKGKFTKVSVTSYEVLQLLVNPVATWHATSASCDHKLLLFTKCCNN
jgi:hypothetical protein